MQVDPDILIAIATLVMILSISSVVANWVDRRWPWVALVSLAISIGLLLYVHLALRPGGLTVWDIPNAFVHVAAMVLN